MKKFYQKAAILSLFAICLLQSSQAQNFGDYQTRATGNWNSTSTWSVYVGVWINAIAVPSSTSGTITILNGHTVTVSSNVTADQLVVNAGGQLTISSGQSLTIAASTGTDFSVSGTVTNSGTLTINSSASMEINSGGLFMSNSTNLNMSGSLTVNNGGTYSHNINGGTIPPATWGASSTCKITGLTSSDPGGDNQAFGNLVYDCPNMSTNRATATSGLTIAGNLEVLNTGTARLHIDQNALTVGGDLKIAANVRLASSGNARTLTVNGNFLMTGGTFTMSDNNSIGTMNVAGNYTHSGGTITETGSTSGAIFFNGSGVQTFTSGGTVSNTINYTVNNGATLQMAAAGTVVSGSSFTLSSGGTLGIMSTAGITSSGATGNVQTTTRSFNTGANYIYNGTAAQVTGNGMPATVNRLTIDNSTGVTLSAATTITTEVVFTNGVLNTTSTNLIKFGATATVSGVSNSSYVQGPVQKTGTAAFTFPVGGSNGYHPLSISAPASTATYTAEYKRTSAKNVSASLVPGLLGISNCEYWLFNTTTLPNVNVNVTLSWDANSSCGGPYITTITGLIMARYDSTANGPSSGAWRGYGGVPSGNSTAGTLLRTSSTNYGALTFGNNSTSGAPLPVKLGTVNAFAKNNGVSVEWTALTELNLSKYVVERSNDGMNFTAIGSVTAKNSLDATSYTFFDAAPAAGNNYYRLKSVDIDGKASYSSIVKVNLDKATAGFTVYPNPVRNGSVSFQSADLAKGSYTVKVISVSGQQMMAQQFNHNGGAISQSVQLPQSVKTGIYTLLIENAGAKVMNKTFIVQ